MTPYSNIHLKRVYEEPAQSDGIRLFADRLWPRGVSKNALTYDKWIKDLSPSASLRKSWHQGKIEYDEFKARYLDELDRQKSTLIELAQISLQSNLTLLSSVRDLSQSHLPIIKAAIIEAREELSGGNDSRASEVCYQNTDN